MKVDPAIRRFSIGDHSSRRSSPGLKLLLLLICLTMGTSSGCDSSFKEQIKDFQESVELTSAAVRVYYTEINEFERELYLQERALDPSQEVLVTDGQGNPTPLIGGPFPAESIKARTDALLLLGVYGRRLGELAGSDAPGRFAKGAKALGDNLDGLAGTFAGLSDSTAKAYAGPIGTIVGIFGEMVLESKRDSALRRAVTEGAPAVRQILDLLEKDLTNVVSLQRRTGTRQAITLLAADYNSQAGKLGLQERKQRLEEIRKAAQRYEVAVAFNPTELVTAMRTAHEALVEYVESGRQPKDLATLAAALETFRSRAEQVASAVALLRSIGKETK